jgi:hypothetical protein
VAEAGIKEEIAIPSLDLKIIETQEDIEMKVLQVAVKSMNEAAVVVEAVLMVSEAEKLVNIFTVHLIFLLCVCY